MQILSYKGYQGSIEFDDGQLLIRVLHVEDMLTAYCDKASDAQATFAQLIDEYLDLCKRHKKEPDKPFSGKFNVRVSAELHRSVAMAASCRDQTLNQFVLDALEAAVEEFSDKKAMEDVSHKLNDFIASHLQGDVVYAVHGSNRGTLVVPAKSAHSSGYVTTTLAELGTQEDTLLQRVVIASKALERSN